jgi:hypothetical protein
VNKRFLTAWVVVFIVWMVGSFLVHGMLLAPHYKTVPELFRADADAQQHFPMMLLAHAILAGALVWIYARGVEDAPWAGQGVRFGLAVALLTAVPWYLIYYAVQPMPGDIVARQIVFDTMLTILLGLVVAYLYRDRGKRVAM